MHYYQFNIGDYKSHTEHLEPLEDIAYRRLLDWCYLHEKPLPLDVVEIGRLIRMRTHSESIAIVLNEFFVETENGWINNRVLIEVEAFKSKSEKASQSAKSRWNKKKSGDANALQTHSEGNAKHKPLTTNQEPVTIKKTSRFTPPSNEEVSEYCNKRGNSIDPQKFIDHYEANGWMRGKNKIKSWQACIRTWEGNQHGENGSNTNSTNGQAIEAEFTDELAAYREF